MVVNKRKKNSRQRGSHTHGWGAKKKHRGAGNRGGRGMAGSGKRADTRKPSIWKEEYFGKHGFIKKGAVEKINGINIKEIEEKFDKLAKSKAITKEGDAYAIDISKIGCNKLLGSGNITRKYKIKARYASKGVIEKIKEAGGEIILSREG